MKLLKSLRKFVQKEGRLPKVRDCNDSRYLKSAGVYIREFGSWSQTLDVFVATLIDKNIKLKRTLQKRPSPQTEEDITFDMVFENKDRTIEDTLYLTIEEALEDEEYQGADHYRDRFNPSDMARFLEIDMDVYGWEETAKTAFDDYMFNKF